MPFLNLEELHKIAEPSLITVAVEGVGSVKVAKLSNKEIREQAAYIAKLKESEDPSLMLKVRYSMVGVALRNEDGSRMFASLEQAEQELDKLPYDVFMGLWLACVLDINELNDDAILERAKKFKADQFTGATVG